MPLYRFYRIVSDVGSDEYIGSTRSPLHKRFWEHRNKYSKNLLRCASKALFDKYGMETCSIVLIHELECATKEEALREERRIYDERKESIVNIRRPYASHDEKKQYGRQRMREYREANKESISQKKKEHYQANKESILQKNREYRETKRKERPA